VYRRDKRQGRITCIEGIRDRTGKEFKDIRDRAEKVYRRDNRQDEYEE